MEAVLQELERMEAEAWSAARTATTANERARHYGRRRAFHEAWKVLHDSMMAEKHGAASAKGAGS